MLFADLGVVTTRLERLEASLKKPRPDRELLAKELEIVKSVHAVLEEGKTVASLDLSAEDKKPLRSFGLLTDKPEVVLLNTLQGQAIPDSLKALAGESLAIDAKLELELSQLDPEERAVFMTDMGVSELGKDRIIRRAYDTVGIITFFTAGEPEVRGWNLERGANAVAAAGKIHTDLAKGFIRAEVTAYDDLFQAGSVKEAKARINNASKARNTSSRTETSSTSAARISSSDEPSSTGDNPHVTVHRQHRTTVDDLQGERSILPGSRQTAVAQRIIGVRSSIPEDRGESRLGRVSRLARQSESDASVVPYTRDAMSSMVSSGRAIVNSDAGLRGGAGFRDVLEAAAFAGCPWPVPEPKPGGRGQVANPSQAGGVCR